MPFFNCYMAEVVREIGDWRAASSFTFFSAIATFCYDILGADMQRQEEWLHCAWTGSCWAFFISCKESFWKISFSGFCTLVNLLLFCWSLSPSRWAATSAWWRMSFLSFDGFDKEYDESTSIKCNWKWWKFYVFNPGGSDDRRLLTFFLAFKLELSKTSHTTHEITYFHPQLIASDPQARWRHSGK